MHAGIPETTDPKSVRIQLLHFSSLVFPVKSVEETFEPALEGVLPKREWAQSIRAIREVLEPPTSTQCLGAFWFCLLFGSFSCGIGLIFLDQVSIMPDLFRVLFVICINALVAYIWTKSEFMDGIPKNLPGKIHDENLRLARYKVSFELQQNKEACFGKENRFLVVRWWHDDGGKLLHVNMHPFWGSGEFPDIFLSQFEGYISREEWAQSIQAINHTLKKGLIYWAMIFFCGWIVLSLYWVIRFEEGIGPFSFARTICSALFSAEMAFILHSIHHKQQHDRFMACIQEQSNRLAKRGVSFHCENTNRLYLIVNLVQSPQHEQKEANLEPVGQFIHLSLLKAQITTEQKSSHFETPSYDISLDVLASSEGEIQHTFDIFNNIFP